MAGTKVSLKLLIDKQKGRVLFAEGGNDFVDLLFTILTLPLGTVVKLLTKSSMVGTLGKLYESVENLNQIYMQPNQTKDPLLNPKTSFLNHKTPLLQYDSDALAFYKCSKTSYNRRSSNTSYDLCTLCVSASPKAICPTCQACMTEPISYVAPPSGTGVADGTKVGYVREMVTYMIKDDLEVEPMSTISGITLLNAFNIRDIGAVEEKVFDVGMDEALQLVETSLRSKTVLTEVFLRRKK